MAKIELSEKTVLAIGAGTVAVVLSGFFWFFPLGPGGVGRAIGITLAFAIAAFIMMLPRLRQGQRGAAINNSLPFFITHFGVLATTNLRTPAIIAILAENQEYHGIAQEMKRVHRLISQWNLSLADALRSVAATTPSEVFSEFLRRLAHSMESGQDLERFLRSEQEVVMQQYGAIYDAALLKVENWKELYTSTVMSIGFMSVFAAILPLIVGGNVKLLMFGVAGVSIILEILMGITLKDRIPYDRLTPNRVTRSKMEKKIIRAIIVAAIVGIIGSVTLRVLGVPLALAVPVAVLPFMVPGILAQRFEKSIRAREDAFPAFIRSLGAAAAARGGDVNEVLSDVKGTDLGPLAQPIDDLHVRLGWQIDDRRSWRQFGADSGSRLIDSFTDMFIEGIESGGRAGPISQIISDNMVRVLGLRTSRRATAGSFRGLLVGLTGGLAAVMFVGVGILGALGTIFGDSGDLLQQSDLLQVNVVDDLGAVELALLVFIAFHAIASSVYFKIVEGGTAHAAGFLASIQTALGCGVAAFAASLIPSLL